MANPEASREPRAIGGLYSVRLAVDGMRQQIETLLYDYDGSIRKSIEYELAAAVNAFDFAGEVRKVAVASVANAVRQSLVCAIDRAMQSDAVSDLIRDGVEKVVRERLGPKKGQAE